MREEIREPGQAVGTAAERANRPPLLRRDLGRHGSGDEGRQRIDRHGAVRAHGRVHGERHDAAVTDKQGGFEIAAMPAGMFRLVASHPAYAPGSSAMITLDGTTRRDAIAITLAPGAKVRGRVVDGTKQGQRRRGELEQHQCAEDNKDSDPHLHRPGEKTFQTGAGRGKVVPGEAQHEHTDHAGPEFDTGREAERAEHRVGNGDQPDADNEKVEAENKNALCRTGHRGKVTTIRGPGHEGTTVTPGKR